MKDVEGVSNRLQYDLGVLFFELKEDDGVRFHYGVYYYDYGMR